MRQQQMNTEDPLARLAMLRQSGLMQDPLEQASNLMKLMSFMSENERAQGLHDARMQQAQQQPLYALAEMMTRLLSTLGPKGMINPAVAGQPFEQLGLGGLFNPGPSANDPVPRIPAAFQGNITPDTAALLQLRDEIEGRFTPSYGGGLQWGPVR
jgi:hypothetical protein